MNDRALAKSLAGARIGVGATLVALPGLSLRLWMGRDADTAGARMLTRMAGIRDLAVGVASMKALIDGEDPRFILQLGVLCDATDAGASVIALRRKRTAGMVAALLTAAGSAAIHSVLAKRLLH